MRTLGRCAYNPTLQMTINVYFVSPQKMIKRNNVKLNEIKHKQTDRRKKRALE